jgi:DMSO/TMAO reductase YedYZ molybdopterin-dependent catalytic subunit
LAENLQYTSDARSAQIPGFPLRLRTATKLGFKNPKWITAIEVTNDFPKTYWSERGLTGSAAFEWIPVQR